MVRSVAAQLVGPELCVRVDEVCAHRHLAVARAAAPPQQHKVRRARSLAAGKFT